MYTIFYSQKWEIKWSSSRWMLLLNAVSTCSIEQIVFKSFKKINFYIKLCDCSENYQRKSYNDETIYLVKR